MSNRCAGCGTVLFDYGPLGLSCPKAGCMYEWEVALQALNQRKKEEELKELARLKAKYEGDDE